MLAQRARAGRETLQLESLIRDLHASYVAFFKGRTARQATRDARFMTLLKVCIEECGMQRPSKWVEAVREALGEFKRR